MSLKYNLIIEKFATFRETIFIFEDDEGTTPFNLTGCTGYLQIRAQETNGVGFKNGTPILELTSANGGLILGGTLGTVFIEVSATQTGLITEDISYYDLILIYADGSRNKILEGKVIFKDSVTQI